MPVISTPIKRPSSKRRCPVGADHHHCPGGGREKPRKGWEEAFDTVLADVPCSGLGVIRKKPEIRYKPQEELAGLPQIQQDT